MSPKESQKGRWRLAWMAVGGGILIAGVVAVVVGVRGSRRPSPEEQALADLERESEEEYLGPEVRRRSVELLFPNSAGGWDREEREVPLPPDESRRLEVVIRAWLQGNREGKTLLSPKTQMLSAFVDENRRAYINLSADATRDFQGGSAMEIEMLSSLARTIAANFPDITDFQILVNGEPVATLGGHISVSLPLSVSYFASVE